MFRYFFVSFLWLFSVSTRAQEAKELYQADYATPSAQHKLLEEYAGKWDITVEVSVEGTPIKQTGTATTHMILGGRYQETDFEVDDQSADMRGRQLIAYDNATQEYIYIWLDTYGTGVMILRGKPDTKDPKQFTLNGTMIDPASQKELAISARHFFIDEDHQKTDFYTHQEEDIKLMSTTEYVRVK